MAFINKQDTNGVKGLLAKGELGYDDYAAGGDTGRIYVGDGTTNVALAKKSEVDSVAGGFSKTASGTLLNGDTVIINEDGTVSRISQETVNVDLDIGDGDFFNSGSTTYIDSTMLNDTEIVVVFSDNNDGQFGKIVKGTINGDSIAFGPENTFSTSPVEYLSVEGIGNNTVFIGYSNNDNGYAGTLIGATFNEDAVIFSNPSVFNDSETLHISISALTPSTGIICFQDTVESGNGTVIVGSLVGNTIVYGEKYIFNTGLTSFIHSIVVNEGKVLIGYVKDNSTYQGAARLAFVSGSALTFGPEALFSVNQTSIPDLIMINETTFIIGYQDVDNLYSGKYILGTISSSDISFGISGTFNPGYTAYISLELIAENKVVITYLDGGNLNFGTSRLLTYDNGSLTIGAEYIFNAENSSYMHATVIGDYKYAVSFRDGGNSNFGSTVVIQESYEYLNSNLTTENFIGFNVAQVSDGEQANIKKIGSIVSGLSGLTPAKKYYVQEDGSLDTTPDETESYAGIAISSTELLVKG